MAKLLFSICLELSGGPAYQYRSPLPQRLLVYSCCVHFNLVGYLAVRSCLSTYVISSTAPKGDTENRLYNVLQAVATCSACLRESFAVWPERDSQDLAYAVGLITIATLTVTAYDVPYLPEHPRVHSEHSELQQAVSRSEEYYILVLFVDILWVTLDGEDSEIERKGGHTCVFNCNQARSGTLQPQQSPRVCNEHTWENHCSGLGSVLPEGVSSRRQLLQACCKGTDGIFHVFCFTTSVFAFTK